MPKLSQRQATPCPLQPASLLTFSGAQHVRQAVSITKTSSVPSEAPSHRVFTFCLELVERPGAYKVCSQLAGHMSGCMEGQIASIDDMLAAHPPNRICCAELLAYCGSAIG